MSAGESDAPGIEKAGRKRIKGCLFPEEQPIVPHLDIEESRISVDGDASDIQQDARRRSVPGSVAFVPSVAGLLIAGEVVKKIYARGLTNEKADKSEIHCY